MMLLLLAWIMMMAFTVTIWQNHPQNWREQQKHPQKDGFVEQWTAK
jgi:hypothetical protein